MKFIVYRDSNTGNLWITNPKHEDATLQEMSESHISTDQVEKIGEFRPKTSLMIEHSFNMSVIG